MQNPLHTLRQQQQSPKARARPRKAPRSLPGKLTQGINLRLDHFASHPSSRLELAQRLRTLIALEEYLSSVPRTHRAGKQQGITSVPEDPAPSSGLFEHCMYAHTSVYMYIHTYKQTDIHLVNLKSPNSHTLFSLSLFLLS